MRHRRALDVPARPPRPPRARPRRLAGLRRLPEGEVPGVTLPLVHVDPRPGEQLIEVLPRVAAVGRKPPHLEVHVVVHHVGYPSCDQPFDQRHHLRDVPGRARLHGRRLDAQLGHLVLVPLDVPLGQLADGDPEQLRPGDDLIVHVGIVLDEGHPVTPVAEVTRDHVEDEGAPRVPDMGDVVGRDAADVHPSLAQDQGREGLLLPRPRVVDPEAHRAPRSGCS